MNLWHRHTIHAALLAMLNHMPRILVDLVEDSESRKAPCPVCDGIGYVALDTIGYTCIECDSAGRVRVPGDAHARRWLFEILGLIGPRKARTAVAEYQTVANHMARSAENI